MVLMKKKNHRKRLLLGGGASFIVDKVKSTVLGLSRYVVVVVVVVRPTSTKVSVILCIRPRRDVSMKKDPGRRGSTILCDIIIEWWFKKK